MHLLIGEVSVWEWPREMSFGQCPVHIHYLVSSLFLSYLYPKQNHSETTQMPLLAHSLVPITCTRNIFDVSLHKSLMISSIFVGDLPL